MGCGVTNLGTSVPSLRWKSVCSLLAFIVTGLLAGSPGEDPGYRGCFSAGTHFQESFVPYPNVSSVDECLIQCRQGFRSFAAISGRTCFCTDTDPGTNTNKHTDEDCNVPCPGDDQQTCGGVSFYSIFSTTKGFCEPLKVPENGAIDNYFFRLGKNVTFTCFPGFHLSGPAKIGCVNTAGEGTPVWDSDVPSCVQNANESGEATRQISKLISFTSKEDSTIHDLKVSPSKFTPENCQLWPRILIEIVVIIAITIFIIALFCVFQRYWRSRKERLSGSANDFTEAGPLNTVLVNDSGTYASPRSNVTVPLAVEPNDGERVRESGTGDSSIKHVYYERGIAQNTTPQMSKPKRLLKPLKFTRWMKSSGDDLWASKSPNTNGIDSQAARLTTNVRELPEYTQDEEDADQGRNLHQFAVVSMKAKPTSPGPNDAMAGELSKQNSRVENDYENTIYEEAVFDEDLGKPRRIPPPPSLNAEQISLVYAEINKTKIDELNLQYDTLKETTHSGHFSVTSKPNQAEMIEMAPPIPDIMRQGDKQLRRISDHGYIPSQLIEDDFYENHTVINHRSRRPTSNHSTSY